MWQEIKAYESQLEQLEPDELQALVDLEREFAKQEAIKAAKLEDASKWYNQPEANADYDYWSKAAYWSLDEAIALVLGKDPRKVTWNELCSIKSLFPLPFVTKFEEIRELAQRAVSYQQLQNTVRPGLFLVWANQISLDIPEALEEAVKQNGVTIEDWKYLYDELLQTHNDMVKEANTKFAQLSKESASLQQLIDKLRQELADKNTQNLTQRERSSLLKLLLAMATEKYDYRPGTRNEATGTNRNSISSDAEKLGLQINNKTIRKFLDEATELFDSDLNLPEDP